MTSAWKRRRFPPTSGSDLDSLTPNPSTQSPVLKLVVRDSFKTQLRDHVRAVKGHACPLLLTCYIRHPHKHRALSFLAMSSKICALKLCCSRASRRQSRQNCGIRAGAQARGSVLISVPNLKPKSQTAIQIPVEIRNALKELRLHKFYPKVPRPYPHSCNQHLRRSAADPLT